MNPDHLRAAIEKIGIEKPSDYTLVLEEVGRMEAEEKLVDQSREALLFAALEDAWAENNIQGGMGVEQARIHARVKIDMAKLQMRHIPPDCNALLTASEAFIREAEEMGWGKTSDKALPGAWDALVKATREVTK